MGTEEQDQMIPRFAMELRPHAQQSDGAVQARPDAFEKSPALAVDVPDYSKTPA
jgi:hypothetical protein